MSSTLTSELRAPSDSMRKLPATASRVVVMFTSNRRILTRESASHWAMSAVGNEYHASASWEALRSHSKDQTPMRVHGACLGGWRSGINEEYS